MKNYCSFLTFALSATMLTMSPVCMYAIPVGVFLQVGFDDPEVGQGDPNKTPPVIPAVSIENHELSFDSTCMGYQLQLTDSDGIIVYSTIISSGSIVLPSYLIGNYKLRLQEPNSPYFFYGYIIL